MVDILWIDKLVWRNWTGHSRCTLLQVLWSGRNRRAKTLVISLTYREKRRACLERQATNCGGCRWKSIAATKSSMINVRMAYWRQWVYCGNANLASNLLQRFLCQWIVQTSLTEIAFWVWVFDTRESAWKRLNIEMCQGSSIHAKHGLICTHGNLLRYGLTLRVESDLWEWHWLRFVRQNWVPLHRLKLMLVANNWFDLYVD